MYIDLGFYRELRDRLGAPGDFAQAYVIAHEVGHRVQNLLGLSDKVHAASPRQLQGAGGLSVRLELQADCLAGVWARDAELRGQLDPGDIEEAMRAAEAIGDDRLQKMARGTVPAGVVQPRHVARSGRGGSPAATTRTTRPSATPSAPPSCER